jgi:hypothetical protein
MCRGVLFKQPEEPEDEPAPAPAPAPPPVYVVQNDDMLMTLHGAREEYTCGRPLRQPDE